MHTITGRILRAALIALALSLGAASPASASPILYAIGGNSFGAPVRITRLDTSAGHATTVFDLQTSTGGFSGLTYRSSNQQLYSVMLDNNGGSHLVSFSATGSGTFASIMNLDDPTSPGLISFNGGLVYDPFDGEFYSIGNDSLGNSTLYRIDVLNGSVKPLTARLPQSFNGGLTLRADGTLAALQNDANGMSSIYSFALSPNSATASLLFANPIGPGFYGGIADTNGLYYALQTDMFGASSLTSIDASGHAVNLFAAGDGFLNAGLTAVPDVTPVPEPSSLLLSIGGSLLAFASQLKSKRRIMSNTLKAVLIAAFACSTATAFAQYSTPTRIVNANTQPVPVLSTAAQNAFGIDFPFASGNGNNRIDFPIIIAPAGKRIVVDMISMSATLPSENEIYVPCLAQLPGSSYTTTTSFPFYAGDTRIKEVGSQAVKIYGDSVVCGILRSDVLNTSIGTVTVVGHYEPIL